MENKQIIIDGIDVSGCKCYNPKINMDCLLYPLQSDACKNTPNCYYKQLKRKEQECEELKKELIKKDQVDIFFNTPIEGWSNDNAEICKFKQTLVEIKEIAEGMHDLWINKTPYTDMDNLVKHLLECELNRIRYKLDEISECEVENANI